MSKLIGDLDDYVCTVSKQILEIAKNELREDDNIRHQSLEIFRNWILKNEDILKCRLGNIDRDLQNSTLLGRAWALTFDTLIEEESNQITGIILINNCNGLGVEHLAIYTPIMIQRMTAAFNKAHPVRYSAMHFVGLPSYFEKLLELFKSILGEKLRERVIVHSAETKIEDIVPKIILPKEYGGDGLAINETKQAWNDEILASRHRLLLNSELAIAERYKYQRCKEMFPNEDLGIDGSFRKLQID